MSLSLYKSMVRLHLEYASVIWSPLYKKDTITLENVQCRPTRLVPALNGLSYPERRSFFVCCLAHRGSTFGFLLLQCSSGVIRHPRDLQVSVATRFCRALIFVSSKYLSVIYLFPMMIHWWVRKPPRGPNNCMFWAMTQAEGEVGFP